MCEPQETADQTRRPAPAADDGFGSKIGDCSIGNRRPRMDQSANFQIDGSLRLPSVLNQSLVLSCGSGDQGAASGP